MKRFTLLVILLCLSSSYVFCQGCSDAGFCSMGAMRPSQIYSKAINFKLRELEVSYYQGSTKLTPTINAATLDFNFGITDKMTAQLKLPYMWVDGSLGKTSDLGDVSFSLTRNMYSTENYHINATIGGKIPTNQSDIKDGSNVEFTNGVDERSLPMYYQTSLGSYDLVLGASYISKKWMFATGFQFALTENENSFDPTHWPNYPFPEYIREYDIATNLKRGTDFMVRAERAFHFAKWDIRLGVLPIFRISKDEIDNAAGERIKLDKTTGMALTAIGNVAYHFNTQHSVKLMYGLKITDRDVNPDGLTRDDVISIAYAVRFQ
ncbi:hypothetical protein FNH22_21535 [Fulvivirga sp. M361]|uniref:hypothetical protein n=1 Tax=Fulvivirga sp. M361 TaxID=2594266 RepID=UPI00117A1ED1|nr:hypothetical protein [Fulvivirga sp. M361]TRX52636.1 hypothetical protein FNH22_21535 [Fulvivirga sp. M361]